MRFLNRLWRLFEPPVLSEAAKRPSGERLRNASISDCERKFEFFRKRPPKRISKVAPRSGSARMGARRALQSPFYTEEQGAVVKKNKKRGTQKFCPDITSGLLASLAKGLLGY